MCSAFYDNCIIIHNRIVECNRYSDKREADKPDLESMKSMAYILSEYGPLKTIGFIPAREWRKKHGDDDILPDRLPNFPPSR